MSGPPFDHTGTRFGRAARQARGRHLVLSLAIVAGSWFGTHAWAGDEVEKPSRGSWFSAMFNRSSLAALAAEMDAGTITTAEVTEYIRKGGSLERFKGYDAVHEFLVGSSPVPVLNLFIDGPHASRRNLPADRIKSLATMLAAGADPNYRIEDYRLFLLPNLSPLNFAAAGDDAQAIALLLRHGARIDVVETGYLREYGPAIALCSRAESCEVLLNAGADLRYVDRNGNTLAHLAAGRLVDGESALAKLVWLKNKGMPLDGRNAFGKTPRDLAREAAETARKNELGERVVKAADEGLVLLQGD